MILATIATIVKWGLSITGAVSIAYLTISVLAAWRRGEFKRNDSANDD